MSKKVTTPKYPNTREHKDTTRAHNFSSQKKRRLLERRLGANGRK